MSAAENPQDDPADIGPRRICHQCVGEAYLRAEIQRTGTEGQCHYCGEQTHTWAVGELADRVEQAFEQHYRLADLTLPGFESVRSGEPSVDAIAGAAEVEPNVAEDIDSQFLLNYLRSHAVQNFVSLASVGTTRESLNTKILLSIPIRYPVADGGQRRIAEILGTVDKAIEQTEALISKQQQVKAGLMHDLFTRGLTPDGQLRPTRAEAPDLYQEVRLGWIPKEWDYALLDGVAHRASGHTPNRNHPEYWDGGIKWVSLADSWRLDRVYISETDKEISALGIANSSAVLHPPGIVVLSRDAGIGKSAITTCEMAVSQHFMCWRCGPKLDTHYLYYWLQYRKREFENIATGTTIPTIGLRFLKAIDCLSRST